MTGTVFVLSTGLIFWGAPLRVGKEPWKKTLAGCKGW